MGAVEHLMDKIRHGHPSPVERSAASAVISYDRWHQIAATPDDDDHNVYASPHANSAHRGSAFQQAQAQLP